jgi:AbrB family looped-hinge helix DNA binding protein
MTTVTVSPKYQVVIPKEVRDALGIKAGEKLDAIPYSGHIALVPVRSIRSARGFLKGIDTEVPRDPDRA